MSADRQWCISASFCLALAIFLHVPAVSTSEIIGDIHKDHTISFQNETLEINHTVNVYKNATLRIEPGVNIMFRGNGSLIIHGSLVAIGTETSPIDFSSEMKKNLSGEEIITKGLYGLLTLRLVDGNGFSTGRLEIFHEGVWGTVCDDGWTQINSDVACRELGFSSGTHTSEFPGGSGQIWLDDVRCTYGDSSLKFCQHRGFGTHNCAHSEDVGLRCRGRRLFRHFNNTRMLLHFVGGGKSSLKNVKIHAIQEYQAENVSSSTFASSSAIVCNGGCPAVENLNITGFAAAFEIRNYGDVLVGNVKIMNCFHGVVAFNNEANSTSVKDRSKRFQNIFRLENITVNSSHVAVLLENHYSFPIKLNEIVVTNTIFGVHISKSMFTKVEMSDLSFDTGFNAITTKTMTTPGYFEHVDLCDSSNNLTYNASFPVEITYFNSIYYRTPCAMVFATSPDNVLSGFVSEATNVNLRILDYNSSDLLLEISREHVSQHFIMDWQSTAIIVEVQFPAYWWSFKNRRVKIFLTSHPKASLDTNMHVISNVVINRFTGSGINLHVNHDTTVIQNSRITNTNGNGVSVFGERSALKLLNNTFQHNNNTGTSILVLRVNYYVSFHANGNVFHNDNMKKVLKLSIRDVRSSVIRITNNEMVNNSCENLVDVEYLGNSCFQSGLQKIVLANNQWSENQIQSSAVVFKQTSASCSAYKTSILVTENDILDNTGSGIIDIQSWWSTTLILKSNLFQRNALGRIAIYVALSYYSCSISMLDNALVNNTAEKLFDVTGGNPTVFIRNNAIVGNEIDKNVLNFVTGSYISLLHNVLVNNSGFQLVDVTGSTLVVVIYNNSMARNKVDTNVLNLGNLNRVSSFNITRNSLMANGLRRRYPIFYEPVENVATVICSSKQISVNKNFFENPLFRWEFILTGFFEPYEINVQYNWWGTKDKRKIILKIFDFRWRSYLAQLNFSPFLASANVSDVSTGDEGMYFLNGSILGSHITEYVELQIDNSPYTVIKDVVVYPNATLTVKKGVQINIVPNAGFYVYGKLELLGEWNNPIQFDIATKFNNFDNYGVYPIRLVNGSKPWEGIVEVFYNNTWGTICDDGYSSSNGPVLCKQLGYQGYSGSFRYTPSSSSSKPVWWRYLRCNSNTHHDISSCSFQGWGVFCYYRRGLWTVRCDPGYWRGIRFRETSKASKISHVRFHRGGAEIHSEMSSFVLHFDVLRQSLDNVEIHNPLRDGIKIALQEPGFVINNIAIHNNPTKTQNYRYKGIETSSALRCHNCSVSGKHIGLYSVDFNIQSFLNDREIKYVDSLAVPGLMLRKEILMCEQNMTVVLGKDDMKIIAMFKYPYSYNNVKCLLALKSLFAITLVTAEIPSSLYETLNISTSNVDSSNNKVFTLRQHEVYTFGPGNLTLCYWRKAYQWGTTFRFVIFSSQDGNTHGLQKHERRFALFGGALKNNYYGIYIQMSTGYVNLQNVSLKDNEYGIFGHKMSTIYLNLKNVSLKNNNYGIHSYFSNISISNCLITDGHTAMYMRAGSLQTLLVTDSGIYNYYMVINHYSPTDAVLVVLYRCTLVGNNRIVKLVNGYRQSSITLDVSKCSISRTRNNGFDINLDQFAAKLSFNNNTFFENEGTLLRIWSRLSDNSMPTIRIEENVFVNNFLSPRYALIDFSGKGVGTIFINICKNSFTENKCSFLVKVDIRSNRLGPKYLFFKNNILEDNEGIQFNSQEYVDGDVKSYTLGLHGCVSNQFNIQYNVFDNELMEKELFLGQTCGSNHLSKNFYIDATLNYWGKSSTKNLRERIFHLANWNDRPRVKYLPAVASRNFSNIITSESILNQSQIGGYVSTSLRLSTTYSPYVVMNDLTISENVTLEIEAGVQIYFKSNIGLLVLGNIIAHGTTREKVKLCSLERKCKHEERMIRLTGRNREYRGKLEIFVDGRWLAACRYYFTSRDGSVACRQLGYGKYIHHRVFYGNNIPLYKVSFHCNGNETSLTNCVNQTVNYCGSAYYGVFLECERHYRWGNIRIAPLNTSDYYGQNEQSALRNVVIHGAGYLNDQDVPSLQIIERSPSVTSFHIVESNGIEIIGQEHIMALEHVHIENSLKLPAIVILGNKGSISISQATIMGGNQHGIAIAPIKNMTFFQPYLGQHDLCDTGQKIVIGGQTYVFLNQRENIKDIICAVEILSPKNTTINFRLLSWVQNSYSVKIYRGSRSSQVVYLSDWSFRYYLDKDIVISSNSLTIEAEIRILRGFLADVTAIGQTGQSMHHQDVSISIDGTTFQEISGGAAVHYTSDFAVPTQVKIVRSHVTLKSNAGEAINPSIEMNVQNNDTIEISNNAFNSNRRGGIYIYQNKKQATVNIVNNIISGNINGSEAVYIIDFSNDACSKLLMAGNYLHDNDIVLPHDMIVIKNMAAIIKENVFYDNTARYILNWIAARKENITSIITRNVFFFNKGYFHTLVLKSSGHEIIIQNYFTNPSNDFELTTLPSLFQDVVVNASNNWWGNVDSEFIMKRIKDKRKATDRPRVIYKPFLQSPTQISSIGLCPFGWLYLNSKCYYNLRSAQNFKNSQHMCKKIGGRMFASNANGVISSRLQKLNAKWAYGTTLSIWINAFSENGGSLQQHGCWLFNGKIREASCGLLRPTICERRPRVRCINDCSLNGICQQQTCNCNKGWEKADCSSFHCKDVGNCGSYGTCVGPNHCKCRLGWMGRGCTISYCLPFTTCKSCLSQKGCGWCDNLEKCLPGTAYKTDIGQCKSWFYYNCISVGHNLSCSNNIKIIDCNTGLCNSDRPQSNKGSCQQCRDLENCYSNSDKVNTTEARCYGWNESKCPKGFVRKDYADESRIDQIVLKSNVKIINSEDLELYGCPVEGNLIIVAKQSRIKFKKDDVISSTQAEGIFHKIQDITNTDEHILMRVIPANLEDVFSYGDFSQEVPLQEVLTQNLLENSPHESLLHGILYGDSPIHETNVHIVSSGPGFYVYKCLANTYITNDGEEVTTLFVVIPVTAVNGSLNVGHVILGNNSNGFLETVNEVIEEESAKFVYTELSVCSNNFSNFKEYKKLNETANSCVGGDSLLGLNIVEKDSDVVVGDVIVGRESGSFLGKIISIHTENGNYFAELVPIVSVKDGKARQQFNTSEIAARRRKRASVTKEAMFKLEISKKIGNFLTLSGSVRFTAKMNMELDTSFFLTLQSIGVTLSGELETNLRCNFDLSASYSSSQSLTLIDNWKIGRFCIPLAFVCIPGVFVFDVGLSARVSASAAASLSASLTSTYSITAGGTWTKQHGMKPNFDKEGSTQPSFDARIKEATASASVSLTPTFKVQLPSFILKVSSSYAVTVLETILGFDNGTSIDTSLLVLAITAPIQATIGVGFCSEMCPESGRNIEASFRGGLPKITVSLALNTGIYDRKWDLFDISVYKYSNSKCLSTPGKVPCCFKNGKPGRINPKTKECEEECDCDPDDPTASKGVKRDDGTCTKCEMCPDNSLKRKRSDGKPECPCLCNDDTEREMDRDGSCPCSCTCEDGSKDTIALDGSCPCKCSCNGYEKSTLGRSGCRCKKDKCPVCEGGEEPIWVNRKCLCRKRATCGVLPVCVAGRRGEQCDQPDCRPCQGCSGNGVCVTDSSCQSRCRCRSRWQGRCCDRRRPIRMWGDPHLVTLDGIEFDYFGIGEFWNCKSIANDFGMQVRFFGYGGASLTGAVALKVADNVVTLTTLPISSSGDLPRLRINGVLQNLLIHRSISFANDSIKLNVLNSGNRTDTSGMQVIIMAFQYKSGATVTVEAEYSPVMSRQYLNVNFIPTAMFSKNTEGLCGFMDDDDTNDLIGPSGEQYNDTTQFAESWRITVNHSRSGLLRSWSWNSSNFHVDDVLDSSYTDKNHKPLYTLDNFASNEVNEAEDVCKAKGLENTILNNCVLDVLMTNDTSFADQQSLEIGCPNDCTGKGLCKNSTCTCLDGWSGDDCSIGSCGNCSRGSCVEGFCRCDTGWEGAACDKKATCFAVDNCTSEVHGLCKTTDACECNIGYTGLNCSIMARCNNVLNCSSNGDCVDVDVCKCHIGYTGSACSETSCESLGYCSGNGRCIAFDICECTSGWSGPSCSIHDCNAVNQCSNKGECVGPNVCKCFGGYQGIDCSVVLDCSHLSNCSGNGICVFNNDMTGDSNICSCYLGFAGSNCSQYDCSDVHDCFGNGTCVEPNLCSCNVGFEGEMCLEFSCETRSRCSGNGICVDYEKCQCNDNWIGLSCESPTCHSANDCSLNGLCVSPNKCECFEQYDGENCTEEAAANLNTPIFSSGSYFAVVSENQGKGYVILTVFANDSDQGRSGKISYSIEEVSIANFFMIGHESGQILVAVDGVLDYESIVQKHFTFTVAATDNGTPSRRSEANVTITVKDENDNCPVFKTLPGNYKIPVRIVANDDDYGDNGQIQYSITEETDPDKKFFISSGGTLVANSVLQPGAYSLTVAAEDGGDIPCTRELSLTVVVDEIIFVPAVTSIIDKSSFLSTSIQSTIAPEMLSSAQLQPTKADRTKSQTSSITINNIVLVRLRLLNVGFVLAYRNKSSNDYKNLRRKIEVTLIKVFEKIPGFLGIFDVDFEQGSVVANIKIQKYSFENTQVSTSSLAKAVVNAGDENGRLGELRFDIAFLQQQIVTATTETPPTTASTTETSNEEGVNDTFVGVGIGIGLAVLFCFILVLCLCCCFNNKKRKKAQPNVIELDAFEVRSYHNRHLDAFNEE